MAGCFSLSCFSVAIIAGLSAGRSTPDILERAIIALLCGQVIGWFASVFMAKAFQEGLNEYKHQRKIPYAGDGSSEDVTLSKEASA